MRIILSPAKKMKRDTDSLPFRGLPYFLEETKVLMEYMKSLDYEEAKKIWRCSDKLAALNYQRFSQMELEKNLTPALLAYEGIQYQYMAPLVFEDKSWEYAEEHLRILSGFYGVLRPFDGVTPYRLEMQARIDFFGEKCLYTYWNRKLCGLLMKETDLILNLASLEYSKCITEYLSGQCRCIRCVFGEYKNGSVKETGTKVKMARGAMVRYLSDNRITEPERVKEFSELNYSYSEKDSSDNCFVFIRDTSDK